MKKALIVYSRENEKARFSNEEKTAGEIERHFLKKGFFVKKIPLVPVKKLGIREQFRAGKEIKFKPAVPDAEGFDFVVIGTPIVGSLTSSPIINAYIRLMPKRTAAKKTEFVLFSTGIMPGFAIKKMQSLLSMHGIKAIDSEVFTSIFEFDEKKLMEVEKFFYRFIEKSQKK